ncbi:MAG: hypothetical protein ACFB0B_20725 [Thermonemataceae bacterium]
MSKFQFASKGKNEFQEQHDECSKFIADNFEKFLEAARKSIFVYEYKGWFKNEVSKTLVHCVKHAYAVHVDESTLTVTVSNQEDADREDWKFSFNHEGIVQSYYCIRAGYVEEAVKHFIELFSLDISIQD